MSTNEEVARRLLQHRKVLFAYVYAIVRDHGIAEDVFQEVSLVILRRWEEFGVVRDFWPLVRETARRQSLAALRKAGRESLLLSPEALEAVDRGFDAVAPEAQARQDALRQCLDRLPQFWQQVVRSRYWLGQSVTEMASRLFRSENTLSVTLNRIRSRLADCVRERIRLTDTS